MIDAQDWRIWQIFAFRQLAEEMLYFGQWISPARI
jgi:hypothetical protein